ncbi:hypothetical protein BH09ACT7_BH09ACT7_60310 [soil metagenome]
MLEFLSQLSSGLLPTRHRDIPVGRFDVSTGRWIDIDIDATGAVDRDELTVATFNIWFADYYAEQRYVAIAELLARNKPDVMVFQEVTPRALAVFLAQPWIRAHYLRAAIVGGDLGNYGMLLLSQLPVKRVRYTRLPTQLSRGLLTAEFTINGSTEVIGSVHLESGKAASKLRERQLGRIFWTLRRSESVLLLGDFNMRDAENDRIEAPFRDLWPVLRPGDPGYTEDTSINLMRYDSKNKHRQVRFDRVLLKGSRWLAADIELLGTDPISAAHPRVFPSDHFGVQCRVSRNTQ